MKQKCQAKQQRPVFASNPVRNWLLVGIITLLILIVSAWLIIPLFISSASIKQKIQVAVTEQTDGQLDYQAFGLLFLPRPTIELRQVTLALPDQPQWQVAALRVSPELLPLLTGDLHLALLELDSLQLNLELPGAKPEKVSVPPFAFAAMEKYLATILQPLSQLISSLKLRVNNAQITIAQGKKKQVEIEGLDLQLRMSVTEPHSARTTLQAKLSKLDIYRNDLQQTVKDISLNGSVATLRGRMTATLDLLALAQPALELSGDITLTANTPAITMNLEGSNIDVDAIRRSVLALAGDTTPTREIFDYLRGGLVPQISFTTRGENFSELIDLENILIEGQLQDGKISIPDLKLDLTEVIGDVLISKGVLHGSRLSTRLEGSTGEDGSLKIGLAEDNDLFQLKLKLNADLANLRPILKRVIESPPFIAELEKISNLQGKADGVLTLGDSLNDIDAKIAISDLNLSTNSERVPLLIRITEGQLTFNKERLELGKLNGTLGQSKFTDLSCQLLWDNDISIDIKSGRISLNMSEIYPWLRSQEGIRDLLKEVKQVVGRLDLSSLELKGEINKPSGWQLTSSGNVKDLSIDTTFFPDTINFASGGFTANTHSLTFEKLVTANQDAVLTLTGRLKGLPQQPERIEVSLDGQMGPQSVAWLLDTLKVSDNYAIRAPLSLSNAQISWQPDSTASFKGTVSIEKGPVITVDVNYLPKELQVHQLIIKDEYSDATVVLGIKNDQREFRFSGKLQHETLKNLFVDPRFSSGRLEGDFAINVALAGQTIVTTKGQLACENLLFLFSSDDIMNIEQVNLRADGPQIAVDISKFIWKGLVWEPVKATVSFDQERTDIKFSEAKLCGIESPGLFSISGDGFSLDMTLEGKDLDVATSYTCLTKGQIKMTGSLDFESHVTAKGQMNEILRSLQGPLEMTFSNGMIEQDKVLSRTLEVINVTEIVKGRLPNLASKGLAYTTMTLQGVFQNGTLTINNYFLDGETLNLVGEGKIYLEEETVDVQLLAAPFKTVDTIVRNIPGINYLMAGTLVTIPVSITGDLKNPNVELMSATAVGTSLYNLAERTIKSPIKLIEMINPWGKQNKN